MHSLIIVIFPFVYALIKKNRLDKFEVTLSNKKRDNYNNEI